MWRYLWASRSTWSNPFQSIFLDRKESRRFSWRKENICIRRKVHLTMQFIKTFMKSQKFIANNKLIWVFSTEAIGGDFWTILIFHFNLFVSHFCVHPAAYSQHSNRLMVKTVPYEILTIFHVCKEGYSPTVCSENLFLPINIFPTRMVIIKACSEVLVQTFMTFDNYWPVNLP